MASSGGLSGSSSREVTSPYAALPEDVSAPAPSHQVVPVAFPVAGAPPPGYGSTSYPPHPIQPAPLGTDAYPPPGAEYPPGTVLIGTGPIGTGPPIVMVPENTNFCSTPCFTTCCGWFALYVLLIVAASVLTAFVPALGLLLLALLPAITILSFLEHSFRKSVIRMQMVITFFEAVAWMIPIVIVENVVQYLLIVRTKLPEEGLCGKCILSSLLQAYLVAGLFEESVKYLAVRRVAFKPFVVDPRALIVYSCCAGAAFGTVEDIMYNYQYGLSTAIVRAFISVPLHCGTGLMIGTALADRRFFEQDRERWYKTLILPILVHGTFDAVSFLLATGALAIWSFFIDILILVAAYLYVRQRVLVLLRAFPQEVDVHLKLVNREIEPPGCGCCNPQACPSCYF